MTFEIEKVIEKSLMRSYKAMTELSISLRETKGYLEKYYPNVDVKFLYEFDKQITQVERRLLDIENEGLE